MTETSFLPLRDGARWVYAVTDPLGSRFLTVTAEAPVEIEVVDVATNEVRRQPAWVLRQSDRKTLMYAAPHEHGVEIIESQWIEKPDRRALVVTADLRWSGEQEWSRPSWHYGLRTRRYRRAADEQITVPAGVFACVKILSDEGEGATFWLAAGVGIVRTINPIEGLAPTRYSVVQLHEWDLEGGRARTGPAPDQGP